MMVGRPVLLTVDKGVATPEPVLQSSRCGSSTKKRPVASTTSASTVRSGDKYALGGVQGQ